MGPRACPSQPLDSELLSCGVIRSFLSSPFLISFVGRDDLFLVWDHLCPTEVPISLVEQPHASQVLAKCSLPSEVCLQLLSFPFQGSRLGELGSVSSDAGIFHSQKAVRHGPWVGVGVDIDGVLKAKVAQVGK